MFNLQNLLGNILGGVTGDQPIKRKNGPPPIELTPSQQVVQGADGLASPYATDMQAYMDKGPKGSGGKAAKGAFGGAVSAFQNSMANVAPVARAQFDLDPNYEQRQMASLPHFAYGGFLPAGQEGVVGDGDPDPRNDEIIRARPDGSGVDVLPVSGLASTLPTGTVTGKTADNNIVRDQVSQVDPQSAYIAAAADAAQRKVIDAALQPIQHNTLKDALFGALTGVNNTVNGRNDPIKTWGQVKYDRNLANAQRQWQPTDAIQTDEEPKAMEAAKLENLKTETKYIGPKIQAELAYRNGMLGLGQQRVDIQQGNAQDRERRSFRLSHPFFDPTKASDADKAALAKFGETPESIGAYDYTKPNTKTVGDTLYQWNASTHSYEDSGIKDPTKTPIDYKVTDPATGVTETYTTTNDKAAALKTSLERQGMQIQAAERRQTNQQTFQAGQTDKNNNLKLQLQQNAQKYGQQQTIQKATDAFKRQYVTLHGKPPSKAAIDQYINGTVTPLLAPEQ